MTLDLGTVPTYENPLVSLWHMIELCRNRNQGVWTAEQVASRANRSCNNFQLYVISFSLQKGDTSCSDRAISSLDCNKDQLLILQMDVVENK